MVEDGGEIVRERQRGRWVVLWRYLEVWERDLRSLPWSCQCQPTYLARFKIDFTFSQMFSIISGGSNINILTTYDKKRDEHSSF